MRKAWVVPALLIPLFFSGGCGLASRGLNEAKEWFAEQGPLLLEKGKAIAIEAASGLADKAKVAAIAYVDEKLIEQEKKALAKLDAHLLAVADIDPETGSPTNVKTWEDFDDDKDCHLQPKEYGKAVLYAGKKAIAKGEWGLAAKIGTGGAGGMAIVAAAENPS